MGHIPDHKGREGHKKKRSRFSTAALLLVTILLEPGCRRPAPLAQLHDTAAAPSFECRRLTGMGPSPFGIVAGDWNGDGQIDLAVSSAGAGTVTAFLNRGARAYAPSSTVRVGRITRAMATGDINGDGFTDLAVASAQTHDVAILLGDGAGGFTNGPRYRTGQSPFDTALADLDGDGRLDLVIVNESNTPISPKAGRVSVLFGDGGGAFSLPVNLEAGEHPAAVQVADLDGRHGPDLAVANWGADTVSIFLNGGDRTFTHAAEVSYGGHLPYSLYAADFDGDGATDLAVTDIEGQAVRVLYGDGHGGFPRSAAFHVGSGTRWVTGADLNGDGLIDLITADTASSTVSLLMGRPHGDFAPAVAIPVGGGPRMVIARDLDGDGKPDLAVTNSQTHDVSLLYQTQGKGTSCPPLRIP